MATKTITAATATVFLTVDGLFSSAQQIQGFGTDSMIETDDVAPGVAEMGVDGRLSVGWVPTPKVVKLTLAADSPSRDLMEDWIQAQDQQREVLPCNLVVNMPAIGRTYTYSRGVITAGRTQPNAGKTLAPAAYAITFESCVGAALS